jgi:hypothetical protein
MENPNTDRKPLSELIVEAENNNMKIVIIGAGETGSRVAEVIAHKNFMAIRVENLNEKDVVMFDRANKRSPFDPEPIVFSAPPNLPDVTLDNYKIDSKPFAGFRRKKLKGYQK